MKKIAKVFEWISGIISLMLLVLNSSFIIELVELYATPQTDDNSASIGLSKAFLLVFLIIFMAIMDAVALIRWIMYTRRSAKQRGILKAFAIQLPFFAVFTALFAWLYSLASGNMELIGMIISTLLGGVGLTFIFADIDLYVNFAKLLSGNRKNATNVEPESTEL